MKEVYTANASLVAKQMKEAKKVNFQWMFTDHIGTKRWNKLTVKLSNRKRDYMRSVLDHEPDIDWPGHQWALEQYEQHKQRGQDGPWIGKPYLHRGVKRIMFCSASLYKNSNDYYFTINMTNPETGFKFYNEFKLQPQDNEHYSHKGYYMTDKKVSAGALMPKW